MKTDAEQDSETLDWLEKHAIRISVDRTFERPWMVVGAGRIGTGRTLREATDAAKKEDPAKPSTKHP